MTRAGLSEKLNIYRLYKPKHNGGEYAAVKISKQKGGKNIKMLESRNSYGYGYTGSKEKGFEWLLVYGEKAHQRMKSGYVYKTEEEAIKEGEKFKKQSTYEPYRNGKISAVKAEPIHFKY